MKMHLISFSLALTAAGLLGGCASLEERAARAAEQTRKVTAALAEGHYKISIDRMYPMRGGSRNVSFGYSIEVRNDSLFSHLPYFGRAYQVPYGGGKGLTFSAPMKSYQEHQVKNGQRHIEIAVQNEEDIYLYSIDVFDNGRSSIDVEARQRERISYSGEMTFEK